MPLRILIVDDEPDVREVLQEFLRSRGHAVTALASGREVLDGLRRADAGDASGIGGLDVALVDWHMPGISGRDVVEALRDIRPSVEIIVTTGEVAEALRGIAPEQILRKPFSLRALARRLEARPLA